jgi:hypothetical protein
MDALTSFELEAQRRRETVASDRDLAWARAMEETRFVDPTIIAGETAARTAVPARVAVGGDCQPTSLTRQSAG